MPAANPRTREPRTRGPRRASQGTESEQSSDHSENARDALREGLESPHGAHAAQRPDAAFRRPAPDSRGHHPAGVRHAAGTRLGVRYPERTFAHRRPHRPDPRPAAAVRRCDGRGHARGARAELPRARIPLFDLRSGSQGIVHVIGPELGLTQPGMTIACGDSHTSTHGAFGAVAFGIGTSQVRDVLASQCLAMDAAEGAPDRRHRAGCARASTPRTSSSRSSAASA